MQILTEAEAEAEEFWQKKMLKKGHCLGKAHCIYSDNTVYYTVYITVAKRKACLQPEKTYGYQYLFTVQFFDSYVYRSRINKGH